MHWREERVKKCSMSVQNKMVPVDVDGNHFFVRLWYTTTNTHTLTYHNSLNFDAIYLFNTSLDAKLKSIE